MVVCRVSQQEGKALSLLANQYGSSRSRPRPTQSIFILQPPDVFPVHHVYLVLLGFEPGFPLACILSLSRGRAEFDVGYLVREVAAAGSAQGGHRDAAMSVERYATRVKSICFFSLRSGESILVVQDVKVEEVNLAGGREGQGERGELVVVVASFRLSRSNASERARDLERSSEKDHHAITSHPLASSSPL